MSRVGIDDEGKNLDDAKLRPKPPSASSSQVDLEMQLRAVEGCCVREQRTQAAAARERDLALHALKATQAAVTAAEVPPAQRI